MTDNLNKIIKPKQKLNISDKNGNKWVNFLKVSHNFS